MKTKNVKAKRCRRIVLFLTMVCLMAMMSVTAFAAGPATGTGMEDAEPVKILNNFVNLLFLITRVIGIVGTVYALYQIGTSLKSHDVATRDQAVMALAGSLLILFIKEILKLIGVPV